MIYDTLNNLPNYLGVSDNLDTVIEYIMARDITTLPAGRTRIDGEKAVVTVSTVTPQTSDKALFQRHDQHITLEIDLDGSAAPVAPPSSKVTPRKPLNSSFSKTIYLPVPTKSSVMSKESVCVPSSFVLSVRFGAS